MRLLIGGITLVILISLILLIPLATAVDYDNTSITLKKTPQFCYLTEDVTLGTISFLALHEWEKQLVLNNPINWKMDIKQITSMNWNECNVIIQFVEGMENPLDLGKTDLNENEALITIPLNHENKKLSSGDLLNSLTHELGHSMGLGHYNSGVLNDSDSIMSPQFEPFKNIILQITLQDVLKMNEKYEEGFQ